VSFVTFMSSAVGRSTRVLVGIVLIIAGAVLGGGWLTLSVVGLVPVFAGVFNVCLVAPLLDQPLKVR